MTCCFFCSLTILVWRFMHSTFVPLEIFVHAIDSIDKSGSRWLLDSVEFKNVEIAAHLSNTTVPSLQQELRKVCRRKFNSTAVVKRRLSSERRRAIVGLNRKSLGVTSSLRYLIYINYRVTQRRMLPCALQYQMTILKI